MRRLLAGALIAAAVGCSGPAALAAAPGATTTVTSYYRAIEAQNYPKAFAYLAARAVGPDGHRLTWREFRQLAAVLDRSEGRVTSFSVSVFPALTVVTIYRQRIGPYHTHLRLTRTAGRWAIASLDRI